MNHLVYKHRIKSQHIVHNFVFIPIILIGALSFLLGLTWFFHPEPWILDRHPNEALIKTSFTVLFNHSINEYLPEYLKVIYKFLGLWLITIGGLIFSYLYITRLGTQASRNYIYVVLLTTLLGVYYLIFNFLPTSPLKPILYILTLLFLCSFCFSIFLNE